MDNKNLVNNCVKYVMFAGITYSILKMFPSKEFTNMEILAIISIIIIGIFSLDCLTSSKIEKFDPINLDVGVDLQLKDKITNDDDELDTDDIEDKDLISHNNSLAEYQLKDSINRLEKEDSDEKHEDAINCDVEISKMKKDLENTISQLREEIKTSHKKEHNQEIAKKYMDNLISELESKYIIDKTDIANFEAKIQSGTHTIEEMLEKLEKLKKMGKSRSPKDRSNDMKYSELPNDFYVPLGEKITNQWDEKDEYTILSTDKWSIPQKRAPICVNKGGEKSCDVCPMNSGYPASLKHFDNSRYVSNIKINKQWALDQIDDSGN